MCMNLKPIQYSPVPSGAGGAATWRVNTNRSFGVTLDTNFDTTLADSDTTLNQCHGLGSIKDKFTHQ